MSSFTLSNQNVAAMSPAEAEQFVRGLDRQRRIIEAQIATFVNQVAVTGVFAADKHRTPKTWGKAACNWSTAEAARFVRAGSMLATFDSAAEMAARGDMGVAQMHALASLVANPRVKEHLADGEELLVGQAAELDYDDYVSLLANWERVADEDGAHKDTERTHRNRKASGSIVGNQFFLDAVCGLAQGLQMKEILEAFAKSEWMADWEAGRAVHGHNRWKAIGYTTWRDPKGHWHHYRPDGTEIGWRSTTNNGANRIFPMPAAS